MAKNPYRPLDYLVLPVETLRAATSGLPHETLGILLQLLIRCATEINSGRIQNATTTTCAPPSVNIPGLWHWENNTLILDIYPVDYEAKAISKRLANSASANARWQQSSPNKQMRPHTENQETHPPYMQPHTQPMQPHPIPQPNQMPLHPCAPARVNNHHLNKYSGGKRETHTPPPPPQKEEENSAFTQWEKNLAATHPAGKRLKNIPYDAHASAWQAYQNCPEAENHAELLQAYMASKLQKDKYGHTFFRSTGLARYFDTIHDHLAHAERWAIETGYYKKNTARTAITSKETETTNPDTPTPQELQAFFAEIEQFKNPSLPQHIPTNT